MIMEFWKKCIWLYVVTLLFLQSNGDPKVPCYFIFGDSLVDNGNNNYLDTTAKVNYTPYGIDFPAGPTGRFSNGRNIADILAEMLGFRKSISPFAKISKEVVLQGVNYGSGGAGILDHTGLQFGDVLSLKKQLKNHERVISRISKLLGNSSAAKQHLNKCLYSIGMGSNDYLGNYLPLYYSSNTTYTPQQFAALLIKTYSKHLRKLYRKGARKVAVFALGKLGCVPQQLLTYGSSNSSGCVGTTNDAVQIFNENLKLLIDELNNLLPDANFVYTKDTSDNASYGKIKNVSEACCKMSVETFGHCIPGSVPCSKREEYMFWDAFHPTEAANFISAKVAYNYMSPLFTAPIRDW